VGGRGWMSILAEDASDHAVGGGLRDPLAVVLQPRVGADGANDAVGYEFDSSGSLYDVFQRPAHAGRQPDDDTCRCRGALPMQHESQITNFVLLVQRPMFLRMWKSEPEMVATVRTAMMPTRTSVSIAGLQVI
jgi:hypothetical protein